MSSPIDLVNQLQKLVVSTYTEVSDPFQLYKAKHSISDLCLALTRAVQGREEYTALLAESCQESSALHLVTSLGVADLIAASPEGQLSLKELSSKTNAAENYLSIALSSLLYHGYFTEVGNFGSQIYANNHFSDILRTDATAKDGKSMKDAVGLSAGDGAKATTCLVEAATRVPDDKKKTAKNFAFNSTMSLFEWMASPGNEWRGKRAGKAMVQLHGMANAGIGEDYPWETVASPIIDIGGGIGSFEVMLLTTPKNKGLSFTVFDIQKTVENAKDAWAAKPQWMQDRLSFVAGDFMKPSPSDSKIPTAADGAGTYVIRHVLHDWDDSQVLEILSNVRNAMLATSSPNQQPKLILVEMLLDETSSRFTRTSSLQLLSLSGGITRTQVEMGVLVEKAGFAVEKVSHVRGVDMIVELKPVIN